MGDISTIKTLSIGELIPYQGNAKIHGKRQIEALAESIKEFGFLSPVLIDKNNVIIAGHGRVQAATLAGLEKVPCICVEGLTEEQKKAYIIADNRLSEVDSGWDMEIVAQELASISLDFDLGSFEFDIPDLPAPDEPEEDSGYYGDERERTNRAYHLDISHRTPMTDGFWQMPIIYCDEVVPTDLIGFNYAKTSKEKAAGIHFYVDDYQFERVWNYPEKYIDILKEYECILSPDFSLYMDMPMPMKIWNIYRSRQIGAYYQGCGLKVVPTISWAEESTFKFAFKGVEKGSTVAVSTVGVKESKDATKIWQAGMQAMIEEVEPSMILCYGGKVEFDYREIGVKYYDNEVLKNWRGKTND